jgi:GntR family transcriptional regulator, transcriptional repressor for pyruvate dehydrogenase complex
MKVQRIRKAYEQVADQLLALITSGQLAPGTRLPSEAELATQFGVSRTTVREALRMLAARSLIESRKGVSGGHFIVRPDVSSLIDYLVTNVGLLAAANTITIENLIQARELLEAPAAELAAMHRDEDDLEAIGEACDFDLHLHEPEPALEMCREFHTRILAASKNPLLVVAATPIFTVIQSIRQPPTPETLAGVQADHSRIYAAITAGDPDASRAAMVEHLGYLRERYQPESPAPVAAEPLRA